MPLASGLPELTTISLDRLPMGNADTQFNHFLAGLKGVSTLKRIELVRRWYDDWAPLLNILATLDLDTLEVKSSGFGSWPDEFDEFRTDPVPDRDLFFGAARKVTLLPAELVDFYQEKWSTES